jgi:hypothetical protein
MSDSKEQFEKRVRYLLSIEEGISNTLKHGPMWRDGFLIACRIWHSHEGDFRERFRAVVDAKDGDYLNAADDEVWRGYDDAVRVFREAKTLSSGST